ncbi:MAG: substrate-binding domain-containing protein [Opitutae bacterium]|nr:substrate-binding domain-containing protein [Opitutae bacterium]
MRAPPPLRLLAGLLAFIQRPTRVAAGVPACRLHRPPAPRPPPAGGTVRLHLGSLLLAMLGFVFTAAVCAAEIRVVGSDLLGPGFQQAVATFAQQNDAAVALDLRGTRPGIEALRAGRAEVGLFLFPPGETPPGEPFFHRPVAYQTVIVLVPAALPLTQITVEQLRGLYAKAAALPLDRWGGLGLTGDARLRTVAPCALAPGRGLSLPLFRRTVLPDGELKPAVELAETIDKLLARVRGADNTVGLAPALPDLPAGLRVLAVAASARDAAYAPTPETLHDGTYPFRLPLYLVFPRAAAPALQQFLKFLVSDEAARALAQANFLPLPDGVRHQAAFDFESLR